MGGVEAVKRVHCFIMEKIREKPDPNPKPEETNKNFERHRQVKQKDVCTPVLVFLCVHMWYIYTCIFYSHITYTVKELIVCIGEHMWYIHIDMCFHFLITYTPCKRIKISANVFDRHLCALCGIVAYVQMFHTYMHLYVELCVPLLLKMKKSQTISCWFNCYYFREMALEIPRIPHKKYGKNNSKICRDEYERVFWIHTCFKYHSEVCHTWSLQKEIMFLSWFLNDLPFAELRPVCIWN